MNSPLLSIVVPCLNAEPFVRKCIASISVPCSYEIILIDDGSTDETRTICEELQKGNPNVLFVSQQNKGVCAARYEGWKNANGVFVTFLDVDDGLVIPDSIIKLLDGRYDVVKAGGYYVTDEKKIRYTNLYQGEVTNAETALSLILDGQLMPFTHSAIYKRRTIDTACFEINPRFKIGEDLLFTMKLLGKKEIRILSVETPIYYYVQQPDSVMHTKIWGFNYIRDFNTQLTEIVDSSAPTLHHRAVEHRFYDYIGTLEFPEVTFKRKYYQEIKSLISSNPWLPAKLSTYKRAIVTHLFLFRLYITFIHIVKRVRRRGVRKVID